MRWISILSLSTLVFTPASFSGLAEAQDTSLVEVKSAFERANIPNDADITFEPSTLLEVTFPQASGGQPALVTAGVQLQRNQTAIPPGFSIGTPSLFGRRRLAFAGRETTANLNLNFVVSMIDLDAPTPQDRSLSEVRHFLGGNFQLKSSGTNNRFGGGVSLLLANSTPALSEFIQPTPPAGSDPHRYVFLLYDQPPNFNEIAGTFVNTSSPLDFTNFSISDFAREVGLGDPVAGTFMLVGPDPSE